MRKVFTILAAVLLTASVFAQSPEKMSYQAVVRNGSNNLVTSTAVGMQISILQGSASGTAVYVETQTPTSNANGLVSVEIGGGTVVSGDFTTIDWANGPYFIKTETDPAGGTSYTITGTSKLLSVPYALHAKTAETVTGTITETDPVFTSWDKDYNDLINTPTIPTVPANVSAFTNDAGYLTTFSETDPLFTAWDKSTGISITESQISDLVHFTTADETDPSVPIGTQTGEMQYWNGSVWVLVAATTNSGATLRMIGGVPTWVDATSVINPTTGKIWMDRNLGASQVATSSTDTAAYGDLYQWGRAADGHESRTSGTTTTLSSSDTPGHGNFILASSAFNDDWRSPQNVYLWQGVSGVNNPCPTGYRLPTSAELDAERLSWSTNDAAGAFGSPLKLSVAGDRISGDGLLSNIGYGGLYWSSTVSGTYSHCLSFANAALMFNRSRAYGHSVRCLKD